MPAFEKSAAFISSLRSKPFETQTTRREYSEAVASKLLEQLHCYMRAKGYTQARMAAMLAINTSSLSALFSGNYAGDIDTHLKKIEQFIDREAERAEKPSLTKFVETSVASTIFKALRNNHVNGTMGAIIGDSGIGKTEAFKNYTRRNPGVIFVSANRWTHTYSQLSCRLAEMVLRRPRANARQRCEAIVEELAGRASLIIVDQAHQLDEGAHEFLQNLWDECNGSAEERRLGIVLGCTWRFYNQIHSNKGQYLYEQLTSRIDAGITVKFSSSAAKFTLGDIEQLFSVENMQYSLSESAMQLLLKVANGKGGLRNAVGQVEHLQDILHRQKAPAQTQITVEQLSRMGEVMLRSAA